MASNQPNVTSYLVFFRLATNKALSLIQIEERAITELEKAYSANDNPDEYIVIKRCSKNCLEQDAGKLPLDSPWSREL